MDKYIVKYSAIAKKDLKSIYTYIAFQLKSPLNASSQMKRIYSAVRSLEILPSRHSTLTQEPWFSKGIRKLPIDNYIILYLVNEDNSTVTVLRIVYGGRNLENTLNYNNYNAESPALFINEEREPYGTK